VDLWTIRWQKTASEPGRLPWISRKKPRLIHRATLCPQAPQTTSVLICNSKVKTKRSDSYLYWNGLCPDLSEWPQRWCYEDRDELPGQQIVACFKPFLRHLLTCGLSPKTRRLHRDNLWLLGGELIGQLGETPTLRKRPIADLIANAIDDEGGPMLSHRASEEEQRSFDSTCRKLHRFLRQGQLPLNA
jgi:hypothetical protein